MSDEAVAATETAEAVSEEQVDKFFESGGETEEAVAEEAPAVEEVKEVPKEAPKDDKTVPYGALHEERMRRKELQEQVQKYGQRTEQMEAAFQKILEKSQTEKAPSFDEDPLNALKYENEQLAQRVAYYDERFQQNDDQAEQYKQQQQFVSTYQQKAAEFAAQEPTFQDAYQYLVDTRQADLVAMGYSPQEAGQVLVREEAAVVGKALQEGVNPAERIYGLARHRGFTPQQEDKSDGEQKMETLEKAAVASKSLSGGKAPVDTTLESLAQMSDDEFDAAWDKLIGSDR